MPPYIFQDNGYKRLISIFLEMMNIMALLLYALNVGTLASPEIGGKVGWSVFATLGIFLILLVETFCSNLLRYSFRAEL